MNKKFITAMVIAFIAVKNPATMLGEVNVAYAAEPQRNIEANAMSEANIATNLNSFYATEIPSVEEKAKIQLVTYQTEIENQKKAEEEKQAKENASKIEKLRNAGLSSKYIKQYLDAEKAYNVPWQVIAAVHYVETHQSGDTVITSYAGAQGPIQFMPSTFKSFAQDGDGNGTMSIGDVDDAIYTGANYLAANGAAAGNVVGALYRYNHDSSYVYHVLSIARSVGYNK
jgi:membrane-bound lytic murein transglycosylase B